MPGGEIPLAFFEGKIFKRRRRAKKRVRYFPDSSDDSIIDFS